MNGVNKPFICNLCCLATCQVFVNISLSLLSLVLTAVTEWLSKLGFGLHHFNLAESTRTQAKIAKINR